LIGSNNQNFEGLVEKLWQAILDGFVKSRNGLTN